MIWDIRPLDGLGPLRLGMSMQQVASLLDHQYPLRAKHRTLDGSINEHRGTGVPICTYESAKLVCIDTNSSIDSVMLGGKNVYLSKTKGIIDDLYAKNAGAKFSHGCVYFNNISINTYGFYNADDTNFGLRNKDRTLGVLVHGAFDEFISDFSDLHFL